MALHMPFGAPYASMAPHLPFGAHICLFGSPFAFMAPHLPFGTPHFLGSQKGLHPERWNLCFGVHISGLSNDTPFFFRQLFHWPAQFLIGCHAALRPAHLWMPFIPDPEWLSEEHITDRMGAICTWMPSFVHVPRVVPLHISLSVMAISSSQYAGWLNWKTSALAKHYFNSSKPSSAQVVTSPWRIVSVIIGCNSPSNTKSEDIYSTIDYRARYPWCLSGVCPKFRLNTTSFIIICQFFIKILA